MCVELCDQSETGEMQSCQDCGRLICFDVEHGDDIEAPAYVTSSGDLYCDRCGAAIDQLDESIHEGIDDWGDDFQPLDLADELDDLPIYVDLSEPSNEPTPDEKETFETIWGRFDLGGEG